MNKFEKTNKETLDKIEQGKRVPLLRIIRYKCLECCNWQGFEVKHCTIPDCVLYKFRLGRNPVPRKLSEKHLKALQNGKHKTP